MNATTILTEIRELFHEANAVMPLVLFALVCLVFYARERREERDPALRRGAAIGAILLALACVTGEQLARHRTIVPARQEMRAWILFAVTFAALCVLFYALIVFCLQAIRRRADRQADVLQEPGTSCLMRHPFRTTCVVLACAWALWIVAYLPGPVTWDALRQLDFVSGALPWTTHHPAFSTWLMGAFIRAGRLIFHSDNAGALLYNGTQTIVLILSLAAGMCRMKKWGASLRTMWLTLAFFACILMWPSYGIAMVKDTAFMIAFFWYFVLLLDLIRDEAAFGPSGWVGLVIASLAICAFRNNGIYNLILAIPFLLPLFKKKRRCFAAVSIAAAAVVISCNALLVPALGIAKGDPAEMLSIPFQQTARLVKYHGDEIPEDERKAIDAALDYAQLPELYKPEKSDPVKNTHQYAGVGMSEREKLIPYLKVWAKQLVRHPETYLTATANNIYGYFYPVKKYREIFFIWHAMGTAVDFGDYRFTMMDQSAALRDGLHQFLLLESDIPVLSLFYTTGFWTWILLVLTIWLLIRRKKMALATIPLWLTILVCVASPVNAYMRYYIPNVIVMPFFAIWVMTMDFSGQMDYDIRKESLALQHGEGQDR